MQKGVGDLKEKICDALMWAVIFLYYGGLALAITGLCLACRELGWAGLALATLAAITIAIVCVMDDLRNIVKCKTALRALLSGSQVVAEAVVCISVYLVIRPICLLTNNLIAVAKSVK